MNDAAIEKLMKLRDESYGKQRVSKQHEKGKLSARERLDYLLDPQSFVELDAFRKHRCHEFGMDTKHILGDGVVTGYGTIQGRKVYVYSQDFTVFGGSLSSVMAEKITKVQDLAVRHRCPIIGINDSGGARIQEGVESLGGYADIFYRNVRSSGVVPQISLILGPCAGGAVYSPAMTDFIVMVDKTSHLFITGPDVIQAVTGDKVTFEELGGSKTHSSTSGVVDLRFSTEIELFEGVQKLLSYLPDSYDTPLPDTPQRYPYDKVELRQKLADLVPQNPNIPYDMRDVLTLIFDPKSLYYLKPEFAPQIVTAFAKLQGSIVGVVANNPNFLAGVLDIDASVKGARFVRFCDAFSIPLITFVDVPGFLPGKDQEKGGIIRHGAKLLYAYCEATVPKITVITRKAYGGAYDVMSSKHIGADFNFAWPRAEIAVMGAGGASQIIFKDKIKSSQNPSQTASELTQTYADTLLNPYAAAERGYIDDVILPEETPQKLIQALSMAKSKKETLPHRKHGNIPL